MRCVVYPYNRFTGRIGKIVKIEKYLPFRTSGNRNLYLGCNRRNTASGRKRDEFLLREKFKAYKTARSIKKVLLGGNAANPVHSHEGWFAASLLAATSAFGLRDIRKIKTTCQVW